MFENGEAIVENTIARGDKEELHLVESIAKAGEAKVANGDDDPIGSWLWKVVVIMLLVTAICLTLVYYMFRV